MNTTSNLLAQRRHEVLEDETRISIYVYLLVHKELTLKQLSEYLNKGKTTIHHHIRKLEESGIVAYREDKKDAKRQLKTRYYSLHTSGYIWEDKEKLLEQIRIDNLVFSKLTEWWISFLEDQSEWGSFDKETSRLDIDLNHPTQQGGETAPFTNLNAIIRMPILDILRWREKSLKK
jgi:DNA-binding transcriptional ArsR family regulator